MFYNIKPQYIKVVCVNTMYEYLAQRCVTVQVSVFRVNPSEPCGVLFLMDRCRWLHWVWAPMGPNTNLAGVGVFTFAAVGSGRSENFAGDPWGMVGFGV